MGSQEKSGKQNKSTKKKTYVDVRGAIPLRKREKFGSKKPGNPNPSPATRWKKGQSGCPSGSTPPGHVTRKALKVFTPQLIAETWAKYMQASLRELQEASMSLDLPAIECIISAALLRDKIEGDLVNTEKILDRAVGRVPQVMKSQISGADGQPLIPPAINFLPVSPENNSNAEGKE